MAGPLAATAVFVLAMAAGYLLGFVRLPGISRDAELGPARLLIGMLIGAMGLSLIPGMFGSKLGEIEAYIPPAEGSGDLVWLQNDLDGAFAQAKADGKMVLVNFTGYACTNCHWMKANMFTKPEVGGVMKNMVLVDLYTDGTDAISLANQKLEEEKFQTVAIPFYALYDADHNVVATFPGLTRKPEEYVSFLNTKATAGGASVAASTTFEGGPFKTVEGATLDLNASKGKVLVVNYWATWCIPCRQEIPEFNKMQKEMGPRGVEVIGISMDEDGATAVKPFLKQVPMNYTVGLGTGQFEQLPITIVYDRAGRKVQRFEGFTKAEDIRAAVEKALAATSNPV